MNEVSKLYATVRDAVLAPNEGITNAERVAIVELVKQELLVNLLQQIKEG